jgi:hypothetical protein
LILTFIVNPSPPTQLKEEVELTDSQVVQKPREKGTVFMQWARPIDNGGSTDIEYKYGYSKTTETCETVNKTSEQKLSFTGLEIDQKYRICVRAMSGVN